MRKQLIKTIAFCAACGLITAQAQTSGSSSSGSSSGSATDPSSSQSGSSYGSQSGTSSSQSGTTGLSATGRSQQQSSVRASDLMDANIVSQQGSTIGSVSDVIINPQSGRVDFAIIELSSSASSSGSGATGSGLLSGDKQVPVPWSMLKSQSTLTSTAGTTTTASSQKTFVFSGDQSKLQNAPAFDESRWQSQNTSEWRQSVYSHYGVQPGSATGGGTSPGGSTYPGSDSSGSSSGGSLDESGSSSGAGQSGSSSGSSGSSTQPGSSSSGSSGK